ncbi:hypothetical protein LZ518_08595 [Sphingomonas sp. RB56-2]|uniref:Uncharacterized protein n=1 Tax=Sphingomonas brevis TaxID=2908206 RepID=A0ABT0SAJ7_9SPHN|nr:hypothetical protein [Sphingomonas brevis]MCL6741187.1 hypothetical protein [Sphingomonas brevis]
MTTMQIVELAAAAALVLLSVVVYRRKGAEGQGGYGNQGSVIVLFIAILLAVHGLGLLEYRPSQAEIDHAAEQGGSQ